MNHLTIEELAKLLKAAAKAHAKYEKEKLNGVYDKDWPKWYADWMLKNQSQK
jgi:hypothetical protein